MEPGRVQGSIRRGPRTLVRVTRSNAVRFLARYQGSPRDRLQPWCLSKRGIAGLISAGSRCARLDLWEFDLTVIGLRCN